MTHKSVWTAIRMNSKHRRKNSRDSRYELLRIVAMFCVVLCHVIAYNGWALEQRPGWAGTLSLAVDQYIGQFGVAVFYMLSGFFLSIRSFRSDHLIKTMIQTFSYSVLALAIGLVWGIRYTAKDIYMALFPISNNVYWFITAYVIMLAFSPILNMMFIQFARRRLLTWIALLLSFSVLPYISFIGFKYNGLQWTTVVYAICCYLIGGYVRRYGHFLWVNHVIMKIIIVAVTGFIALVVFLRAAQEEWGLARFFEWKPRSVYGSLPIFSISVAAGVMTLISQQSIGNDTRRTQSSGFSSVINVVASSTMGIYLIHQHPIVAGKLWDMVSQIQYPGNPVSGILVIMAESIAIFALLAVVSICVNAFVQPMSMALISKIKRIVFRRPSE